MLDKQRHRNWTLRFHNYPSADLDCSDSENWIPRKLRVRPIWLSHLKGKTHGNKNNRMNWRRETKATNTTQLTNSVGNYRKQRRQTPQHTMQAQSKHTHTQKTQSEHNEHTYNKQKQTISTNRTNIHTHTRNTARTRTNPLKFSSDGCNVRDSCCRYLVSSLKMWNQRSSCGVLSQQPPAPYRWPSMSIDIDG